MHKVHCLNICLLGIWNYCRDAAAAPFAIKRVLLEKWLTKPTKIFFFPFDVFIWISYQLAYLNTAFYLLAQVFSKPILSWQSWVPYELAQLCSGNQLPVFATHQEGAHLNPSGEAYLPSWLQNGGAEGSWVQGSRRGSYIIIVISPGPFSLAISTVHLQKVAQIKSADWLSVLVSVIPGSHTQILLRGKFAVLIFCFACRLKCSQFLLYFMMRKMGRGSKKYHLYVFICAGKLLILPQKTHYSKCVNSWLKVLLLQKS